MLRVIRRGREPVWSPTAVLVSEGSRDKVQGRTFGGPSGEFLVQVRGGVCRFL